MRSKKALNGCAVIVAAFIVPLVVIVIAVFSAARPPADVAIDVRVPNMVAADEQFTVEIDVTNLRTKVQTLDDIELRPADPDAFEFLATVPANRRTTGDGGGPTFWWGIEIEPQETLQLSIAARARRAGSHPLDIGVCINGPLSCAYYETEIAAR